MLEDKMILFSLDLKYLYKMYIFKSGCKIIFININLPKIFHNLYTIAINNLIFSTDVI